MTEKTTLYDRLPYTTQHYSGTAPERLHTLARLHGLTPPGFEACRVLELGCGNGNNLIHVACCYPRTTCLGLDMARVPIAAGRRMIDDLGLDNIMIELTDIVEATNLGIFDYVIVHGLYSWAPPNVRDCIMAICRDTLSEHGLAFISYNILPGWARVLALRDMIEYHRQVHGEQTHTLERVRDLIDLLHAGITDDQAAHAVFLRHEKELFEEHGSDYIIHDLLAAVNQPVYFHQFMHHAAAFGLQFVSEIDLAASHISNMPETVAQRLMALNNHLQAEQYMDYIINRRFRASLLCRDIHTVRRDMPSAMVADFYIAAHFTFCQEPAEEDLREGKPIGIKSASMVTEVTSRILKTALMVLKAYHGHPLAFKALCRATAGHHSAVEIEEVERALKDILLRLVFAEHLLLFSEPPAYTNHIDPKPLVSRWVRYQAAHGAVVTNRRHENLQFDPNARLLIQSMNGENSMYALATLYAEAWQRGEVRMDGLDSCTTAHSHALREALKLVRRFARTCADSALFIESE